jgi:flavin reductase ActVB
MTPGVLDTTTAEDHALRFRDAMASFPSGVTIVTTTDEEGRWTGFTATSFCSLSADPALVLVCLAKNATCHPAFLGTRSWVVQVLPGHHTDLALRFATRGADKFARGEFAAGPDGHPVLPDACAVLECDAYARYDGGDHTILVGRVTATRLGEHAPTVYFRRGFHALPGA